MRVTERVPVVDPSEVKDGFGQRTAIRDRSWAVAITDIVAHLVSVYSILEVVVWQHPEPPLAMGSYDLASEGVCVALVALDECRALLWSGPKGSDCSENALATESSWRDLLHQPHGGDMRPTGNSCASNRNYRRAPVMPEALVTVEGR
jgi:hypothetical protein